MNDRDGGGSEIKTRTVAVAVTTDRPSEVSARTAGGASDATGKSDGSDGGGAGCDRSDRPGRPRSRKRPIGVRDATSFPVRRGDEANDDFRTAFPLSGYSRIRVGPSHSVVAVTAHKSFGVFNTLLGFRL